MKKVEDYRQFLASVKEQIKTAQVRTVVAANGQMLWLYWKLGNYILQNQDAEGWGAKVIDKLSLDLTKAFPMLKGFSARSLKYMRRFAEIYPVAVLQKYFEYTELLKGNPAWIGEIVIRFRLLRPISQ
jgi:predicted nuclease of restriction endonuclease-like (RecB) superfamily